MLDNENYTNEEFNNEDGQVVDNDQSTNEQQGQGEEQNQQGTEPTKNDYISDDTIGDKVDEIDRMLQELEKEIEENDKDLEEGKITEKQHKEKKKEFNEVAKRVEDLKSQLDLVTKKVDLATKKIVDDEVKKEINAIKDNFSDFMQDPDKDIVDVIKFAEQKNQQLTLEDYAKIKYFDELIKEVRSADTKFNPVIKQKIKQKTEQEKLLDDVFNSGSNEIFM